MVSMLMVENKIVEEKLKLRYIPIWVSIVVFGSDVLNRFLILGSQLNLSWVITCRMFSFFWISFDMFDCIRSTLNSFKRRFFFREKSFTSKYCANYISEVNEIDHCYRTDNSKILDSTEKKTKYNSRITKITSPRISKHASKFQTENIV
jgi:hypothetical protein